MGATNGFNGKLYRLATGTRATWGTLTDGFNVGAAPAGLDEVAAARDITVNQEDDEADATTRGNRGWKATVGGLRGVSVDVPMVYDLADPDVLAFDKAYATRTYIPLAFLDGDKAAAGMLGTWADFAVLKRVKGEDLAGVQTVTYSVKPGYSAVPPELVKVGGGS